MFSSEDWRSERIQGHCTSADIGLAGSAITEGHINLKNFPHLPLFYNNNNPFRQPKSILIFSRSDSQAQPLLRSLIRHTTNDSNTEKP